MDEFARMGSRASPQCSHHPLFFCPRCTPKKQDRRDRKLDFRSRLGSNCEISPVSPSVVRPFDAYDSNQSTSPGVSDSSASPPADSLPASGGMTIGQYTVSLFLASHPAIFKGHGLHFPMLTWAQQALKSPDSGPTFRQATEALSLITFANAQNRADVRQIALETYQQAMRSVSVILRKAETQKPKPETLMAVFVLSLYEYISGAKLEENNFLRHLLGLRALLIACDIDEFSQTSYGKEFLQLILVQNAFTGTFVSKDLPPINHPLGWFVCLDDVLERQHYQHIIQLASLRSRTAMLDPMAVKNNESIANDLRFIMSECTRVKQDLMAWAGQVFIGPMAPQRTNQQFSLDGVNLQQLGVWPGDLITYGEHRACILHASYLLILLTTCITYLKCEFLLSPIESIEFFWPMSNAAFRLPLLDCVNDICAAVPYGIGVQDTLLPPGHTHADYNGSKGGVAIFYWVPILFSLATEGIPDKQRQWLLGRMRYIGNDLGISIASMFAELMTLTGPLLVSGSHDRLLAAFTDLPGFELLPMSRMYQNV